MNEITLREYNLSLLHFILISCVKQKKNKTVDNFINTYIERLHRSLLLLLIKRYDRIKVNFFLFSVSNYEYPLFTET